MTIPYRKIIGRNPINLLEYRNREMHLLSREITRMAATGSARGLIFILDRGHKGALIGATGSYRKDPSKALTEARSLVAMLSSIEAAKKSRR